MHDIAAPAPGNPVLVLVDADPQARAVIESALARRFGSDYRVVAADTSRGGLETLERLAAEGGDVALVAADLHLPGMDGVEFLERAQRLHPRAVRVLLVAMDQYHMQMPLSELGTLQRATALERIDFGWPRGGRPGGVALPADPGRAHGLDDLQPARPPCLSDRR